MLELNCDMLVVGGGVAGLAAAIAASKEDLNVILIEKELEIGFKVKGECIKRDRPIFHKIFGGPIPNKVILNELTERRIYSPSTSNYIDMPHPEPYVSIDYRLFIFELFKELAKSKCEVILTTELLEVIKEDQRVSGAICRRGAENLKIMANFIVGADGAHSKIAHLLKKPPREVFPALKLNYENLTIPNPHRIEFFLMTNPPGAMWMFPKGSTSGECGLVVWTNELPEDFDILQLWHEKNKKNELMGKIIQQAKPCYISKDYLNFGGPLNQIFGDGFVVAGDSGGHVGAIGAAGIISSMTTAYELATFIGRSLKMEQHVSPGMIEEFLTNFKRTPMQKELKNEQGLGKAFRDILFNTFRTAEVIDANWEKLQVMVSQRDF